MRIPEKIKKCVVFLGIREGDSHEPIKWKGTGFFVSYPSKVANTDQPNRGFMYLVTAKHVAVKFSDKEFYVRANTKNGGSILFHGKAGTRWFFHPEEVNQTDLAVFPMTQTEIINQLDYESIGVALFCNDASIAEIGIGSGDDVFIVGLYSRHSGSDRNLPIVRMGNIALFPDGPIKTDLFGNLNAYLVEMRSIGGLSGSPVFVMKQVYVGLGDDFVPTHQSKIYLLGLIHGHWDVAPGELIDVEDHSGNKPHSINEGIAIVIPAKNILETLNSAELQEYRAMAEAEYIRKNSPTTD